MKFLARNYENILLTYRFIRAIGVQLISNLNRKNEKDAIRSVGPSIVLRLARKMPFNN